MTQHIAAADLRRTVHGSNRAHEHLVDAVLRCLALNLVLAVPIHTGPKVRPRPGGGFDLKANRAQVGFGDVLACLPPHGLLWIIECKTGGSRPRRTQRELHERFRKAGALVTTITDIGQLDRMLKDWRSSDRPQPQPRTVRNATY